MRKLTTAPAPLLAFGLTFAYAAVLYSTSAARSPAPNDWGDFVAAASVFGIAHPTGYPVFIHIIALPLLIFPRLWAATAANATAAFAAAAAPALLAWWALRVAGGGERRKLTAVFAAALGAVAAAAPAFWLEATAVEVYGVGTALFLGVLTLLEGAARRQDDRFVYGAAFLSGLAPGVHMTTFIYCLAALAVNLAARPRPARKWTLGAAAFALGLSVFLYLPLRAASATPLKWTWTAVNDLRQFYTHAAGRQFSYNFRTPSWLVIGYHVENLARALWRNAGPLVVAAPVGIWLAARRRAALAVTLAAAYILNIFFLLVYDIPDLARYQLPAVALTLASAAAAVIHLWNKVRRDIYRFLALALAAGAAVGAVVAHGASQRRDDGFMSFYSRSLLAPQRYEAIYATGDTTSNFNVWFRQYTLGHRRDITLFNLNDERYDIDKVGVMMWAALGSRPVYADYFFVNISRNKEALYARGRPVGFIVEITPDVTAPVTTPSGVAAERRAATFLRTTRQEWDGTRRAREYAISVFENLGVFHETRREDEQAERYYVKAACFGPTMAVPRANLARWYWQRGNYARARREAHAALAADRETYAIYPYLAAMDVVEGDLDAALVNARRAVMLKPQDGKTHRLLARVHFARGEWDAAEKEFKATLARKYDDPDTVLALARLYDERGRKDEAFALLAKYVHRHNDVRLVNAYALALIDRGRYADAKAELERAARIAPGTPEIEANLARLEAMGW